MLSYARYAPTLRAVRYWLLCVVLISYACAYARPTRCRVLMSRMALPGGPGTVRGRYNGGGQRLCPTFRNPQPGSTPSGPYIGGLGLGGRGHCAGPGTGISSGAGCRISAAVRYKIVLDCRICYAMPGTDVLYQMTGPQGPQLVGVEGDARVLFIVAPAFTMAVMGQSYPQPAASNQVRVYPHRSTAAVLRGVGY